MEKISLKYIYPNIIKVLDEINLFRIVDSNLKESIVVYASIVDNQYYINMTNTNFGNIINICKLEKLLDVDKFIEKVIKNSTEIKEINDFSKIEEYLLNIGER
ncbi:MULTISPECIES: hypothetical protein [unclassified Clostridioides]|uniref:hypothetical protein n=1 Tax=unclassified Clostridioides TaxID=2635829 RepID=UPI001D0F53EB|nr:hypothetical protein [Clostridioides sp. ZZV14-6150]MCC0662166.1 hypothetical protein [Clostridioides sp. ZZV14-6154]MCC0669954.1 hypothetical protein [Clostridioides sp. ZZV14-6153]MCC0719898.1 hypothetical protein [Clostridioides sp. ZZV14-6105]MCC0724112.1 hypothetical protein [Clostridioides sp. ZZV14-6104]MCC0726158.1 hypothetical protein [Clostridioides sp. ZZV14-6045]MCC0730809.1 hypothetical protein [Clostridioides sp. ZZV14-6048]MCC0735839.1 hypothetical protein [Clostridioides s